MATSYPGATGILGEAPAPLRRFNPRTVSKIPVGDAMEFPRVPTGQAIEGPPPMQPPPRPMGAIPVGQATELPHMPAPPNPSIPTGAAQELTGIRGTKFGANAAALGDTAKIALRNPLVQTGMRGMAGVGSVLSAADAGADVAKGDMSGAAGHVGDAAAGAALALGGPVTAGVGGAWLLGRGIRNVVNGRRDAADRQTLADGLPQTNPLGENAHMPRGMYGAELDKMPMPSAMHQPTVGPMQPRSPDIAGAAAAPNGFGSEVDGLPGVYRVDAPGKNPLYTDNGQPMATGYSTNAIGGAPGSPGSAFTAGALTGPDGMIGTPALQTPQGQSAQGPAGVNPGQAQMLQAKMLDMVQNQAKYGGTAVVRQAIATMQPMLDQALGNGAGTIASMREGGDMTRAQMQQGTTLRGQDLDMYGKQLSSQTTRAIARMEQMQKDRAYQLDVEKFGLDVAKQRLTQRDSNAASLKSWLETTHVGEDGKPDAAKIATYTRGINSYLDAQVQRAQQIAQQLPAGSPEQRAALDAVEQLQQGGVNALDPTRKQQLLKALEVQSKAEAGHSALNPFKPGYVHSDNPMDYAITGEKKGLIQDDYVTANGTVIPKRMINIRDGGVLPTGVGVQDKSFEPIKRTIRQ